MNQKEKAETVKNIIIASFFLLLLAGGSTAMCLNYPYEKTKTVTADTGISVNDLSNFPKHIAETPFKKFNIDADVVIGIKDNFNIYTGTSHNYNIDALADYFFKDLKISDSCDKPLFSNRVAENGSSVAVELGTMKSFLFNTQENIDKNLTYYGRPNRIEPMRDKLFPKKELGFMNSAQAVNIVKEAVSNFNISVGEYNVYPIDYEYIKKIDEKSLKKLSELGIDDYNYKECTKDDEHYLIVIDVKLPNNGLLANVSYDSNYIPIDSGRLFALVGKNGIFYFESQGMYDVTDEEENNNIIGFDEAFNTFKKIYDGVTFNNECNVYKIELSYVPYAKDFNNGIYTLKPTWIFYMYEDMGGEAQMRYFESLIDATTGKEVVTGA